MAAAGRSRHNAGKVKEVAMRAFLRLLRRVLLAIFFLALLAALAVTCRGYALYREALTAHPIEQAVEEVRSLPKFVGVEELPNTYLDAVVAVEDHRFYEHGGIDLIAIGRAAWHDLTTLSLEQGGSTITQQLAKNLFLSQEKDLSRKVAEVFLAFDLEARYDKEEILELYVNTSYFGDGCTGIGEASRWYLGKEPLGMTPCECALMAGLPNAPSALSENMDLAWERARVVAGQMEKYGLVDYASEVCS